MTRGVAQMVEHLASKPEALNLNSVLPKKLLYGFERQRLHDTWGTIPYPPSLSSALFSFLS
jgi:hypothetical protein